MSGVLTKVTQEELEASYGGPAPGANKFIISIGQPGVRIAFLEVNPDLPGKAYFQSAVTLHPVDAISLQRVLAEMLREIEKQILTVETSAPEEVARG